MRRTARRPFESIPHWTAEHPEWWTLALSATAWIVMLFHGQAAHLWPLCLAPSPDTGLGFPDNLRHAWGSGALGALLSGWGIMTLAMMPPLAIPLIRHVAVRSFAARRNRAMAAFLGGLVGVWLLIGVIALTVLGSAPVALFGDPNVIAACFLIAAAWQLAPMKRIALLRCHRTVPLGAVGWRADRDCFRYGLVHGLDCVRSCWALMLAMALAPHDMVVGLGVQFVALTERRSRHSRLDLSALGLAACGLAFLAGVPI
jgi:predicted metal-binding membrane protein